MGRKMPRADDNRMFVILPQGVGGIPGIDGLSGDKGDKVRIRACILKTIQGYIVEELKC